MEEKGTLPFGIKYEGQTYRKFTVREQIVADTIEIFESDDAARALKSDHFCGVCIMAKQLSIEGIPKEAITTEIVMAMSQDDYDEVMAADKRLDKRRSQFRSQNGASEAGGADPKKDGVRS